MSKPAQEYRIGGLKATVWLNQSEKGDFFSVQLKRSYKVEDEWRDTDRLGFDDLLTAAKLLDQAHSWIAQQRSSQLEARKETEKAD